VGRRPLLERSGDDSGGFPTDGKTTAPAAGNSRARSTISPGWPEGRGGGCGRLARRNVHLVEGKLNAPAGISLVGTKLKQRYDRIEPEAVLDIRVRVVRNHLLGAGIVAFSRSGSRFAGGVIGLIGLVRIRCTGRVRFHGRLASR
jgi:hypothetical protein